MHLDFGVGHSTRDAPSQLMLSGLSRGRRGRTEREKEETPEIRVHSCANRTNCVDVLDEDEERARTAAAVSRRRGIRHHLSERRSGGVGIDGARGGGCLAGPGVASVA